MLIKTYKTGYPTEFLVARIIHRTNILLTTINYLKRSPETIPDFDWKNFNLNFRKELKNVYFLIEEEKRNVLKNVFLIFEVTNILSIIRHSFYEKINLAKSIVSDSLIDKDILNVIFRKGHFEKRLKGFLLFFSKTNKEMTSLVNVFNEKGFRAFEESFLKLLMEGLVADKENIEEVEFFLRNFIDFLNINSLWKKRFWDSQSPSTFIEGGFLSINEIDKIVKNENFSSISYLRKIVNSLEKKRFSSDYHLIIYYIANLYLENINLNILYNTVNLIGREHEDYLI